MQEKIFRMGIVEMIRAAETTLPDDVVKAIELCRERETLKIARVQLECMLENLKLARKFRSPICQDTGTFIFFLKLGSEIRLGFDPKKCIQEAVVEATSEVPLRPNVVDPLTRRNTGDNSGEGQPEVYAELSRGEEVKVELLVKGAGSENWGRLYMLRPGEGVEAIKNAVIKTISEARGQPCPPTIVGLGIGGSASEACILAKRALLTPLNKRNPNPKLAKLEREVEVEANKLGIGPMGLGGKCTVLGVRSAIAACHTASLPLAISFQCWAARRASARFSKNGFEIEVPERRAVRWARSS